MDTSTLCFQVKSGSIFDNIIVSDDFATAKAFAEETWGKTKDAEKAAFDKIKEEEKAAKEAEDKANADAAPPEDDADDDEDDDEEAAHDEL